MRAKVVHTTGFEHYLAIQVDLAPEGGRWKDHIILRTSIPDYDNMKNPLEIYERIAEAINKSEGKG